MKIEKAIFLTENALEFIQIINMNPDSLKLGM